MFFLRTTDNTEIQGKKKPFIFSKSKRKGNEIISIELKRNQLSYSVEKILTKKIPKDELGFLNDALIYILKTENSCLSFQDPENNCHFIVMDPDGQLTPTNFVNLTEDDEVLFYEDRDFLIDPVKELIIVPEKEQKQMIKDFSNYVVYSETNRGVIINNYFII